MCGGIEVLEQHMTIHAEMCSQNHPYPKFLATEVDKRQHHSYRLSFTTLCEHYCQRVCHYYNYLELLCLDKYVHRYLIYYYSSSFAV